MLGRLRARQELPPSPLLPSSGEVGSAIRNLPLQWGLPSQRPSGTHVGGRKPRFGLAVQEAQVVVPFVGTWKLKSGSRIISKASYDKDSNFDPVQALRCRIPVPPHQSKVPPKVLQRGNVFSKSPHHGEHSRNYHIVKPIMISAL